MADNKKVGFWESQRLAKERAYEKQASKKKIKLELLMTFAQQLAAMLDAGLPLVSALDALSDQTSDPVFRIIIRNVRTDISAGSTFSDALKKYPRAFPKLFISMVEAGEASGALPQLIAKAAVYFEDSNRLTKKVKSAMAYPIAVVLLAIALIAVMLVFVIPVFAELFSDFNVALPGPTQFVIDVSHFMQANILYILAVGIILWVLTKMYVGTPKGRVMKDRFFHRLPIFGKLRQKIAISRLSRTYSVLLASGVPILRCIGICSSASDNTYIEDTCAKMGKDVSQGGQISESLSASEYFPPMVSHMTRAGEQTGNIEGMMNKIADYYDEEVNATVAAFSSLLEPILIVFLGIFVGGIVIAMFLPIFELANVVGGQGPSGF